MKVLDPGRGGGGGGNLILSYIRRLGHNLGVNIFTSIFFFFFFFFFWGGGGGGVQ